ncbi:MAG TPA: polyphenol oxidase family protein, partial [Tepidisphaeraceae bacterium]
MLVRQVSQTGIVYYTSPLLGRAGVPHAFSTRVGGVSIKPFDSLNLGNPGGIEVQDEWERIHENYRRFHIAIGLRPKQQRCWLHQAHGGDVCFVRRGHEFSNGARADALVGDDPERALSVRVADCVPILLASDNGKAVAAVHAGWRGIIAQIVPNAVRELRRLNGGTADMLAAVGPCIGKGAFEVGPEVLAQFEEHFGPGAPIQRRLDGKGHVDLRKAVELQLVRAGISIDRIDSGD